MIQKTKAGLKEIVLVDIYLGFNPRSQIFLT